MRPTDMEWRMRAMEENYDLDDPSRLFAVSITTRNLRPCTQNDTERGCDTDAVFATLGNRSPTPPRQKGKPTGSQV